MLYIKERLTHDPKAKTLIEYALLGMTRQFWLQDGLLYMNGNRLFMPQHGKLYREVLQECHGSRWARHLGVSHTLALLEDRYYWPHMKDDVKAYVKTCLVW